MTTVVIKVGPGNQPNPQLTIASVDENGAVSIREDSRRVFVTPVSIPTLPAKVLPIVTTPQVPSNLRGPKGDKGDVGTGEKGPALTYVSGLLTRIDYDSGAYKVLSYEAGVLTRSDYTAGSVTTRKSFNYSPDGSLASIDSTTL